MSRPLANRIYDNVDNYLWEMSGHGVSWILFYKYHRFFGCSQYQGSVQFIKKIEIYGVFSKGWDILGYDKLLFINNLKSVYLIILLCCNQAISYRRCFNYWVFFPMQSMHLHVSISWICMVHITRLKKNLLFINRYYHLPARHFASSEPKFHLHIVCFFDLGV